MLLPSLLLLSGVLCGSSEVELTPTYEHEDPLTGDVLICDRCRPGTHMLAHCTAATPTQCLPCGKHHFTELWNYLPRCLYCSNFCTGNQEVETECSSISNRVCRCKEGFYMKNDFCIRHSECASGHGVQTKGTSQRDTVCERCSDGYFSGSSSALEPCVKHQECANGQIELLAGSPYHDTVCGSCEELGRRGELFRKFLSGFFSLHKMRLTKMRKFVSRCNQREERHTRSKPLQRDLLLDQINTCLHQAPDEQLGKLLQMLKAARLNFMVDKLAKTLQEIEEKVPNCSLTHLMESEN